MDIGDKAMTGTRVKRIEKFVNEDVFMLTYGDGLANLLEAYKVMAEDKERHFSFDRIKSEQ